MEHESHSFLNADVGNLEEGKVSLIRALKLILVRVV